MTTDEDQIRALVAEWMAASKVGDVETVLGLLTEDAVFLLPGRPPMRKDEFAAALRAQAGQAAPAIDGSSDIQEIKVLGEWAFMWTRLKVTTTLPGGSPLQREGHSLTILRKDAGRWRLARDANLLAPAARQSD